MTVKDLKNRLELFSDELKVCVSDTNGGGFHEVDLVIIEPHIELYDDENNKITTQDALYIN